MGHLAFNLKPFEGNQSWLLDYYLQEKGKHQCVFLPVAYDFGA